MKRCKVLLLVGLFHFLFCLSSYAQDSSAEEPEQLEQKAEQTAMSSTVSVPSYVDVLYKAKTPVEHICFSPSGHYMAASLDDSVFLFEYVEQNAAPVAKKMFSLQKGQEGNVTSLQFSSDSKYLMCVYDTGLLRVYCVPQDDILPVSITDEESQIKLAAYLIASYKIVAVRQDNKIVECFQLLLTGDGTGQVEMEEQGDFVAISSSSKKPLLLLGTSHGDLDIVDATNYSITSTIDYDIASTLKPSFTATGEYYFLPNKKGKIEVHSTKDNSIVAVYGKKKNEVKTFDLGVNDGLAVLGSETGKIQIVDVATQKTTKQFYLPQDDILEKVCLSPVQNELIFGTQEGYLYRYNVSNQNLPFSQQEEQEEPQESGEEEQEEEEEKKEYPRPNSSLTLSGGYEPIFDADSKEFYKGQVLVQLGYRHYMSSPYYWGVNIGFGMGFPDENFPYRYFNEDGERLYNPFLYEGKAGILMGLMTYSQKRDCMLFCEMQGGAAGRMLYNNSIDYAKKSKIYPSAYISLAAGVGIKWLRLWGGFELDTNLKVLCTINCGFSVPLGTHKNKEKE